MSFRKFKKVAQEKGWLIKGNRVYGEINDSLFTLHSFEEYVCFVIPLPLMNIDDRVHLSEYLSSNKMKLKIYYFETNDKEVSIIIKRKLLRSISTKSMEKLIGCVTKYLKGYNTDNKHYCVFCSNECANDKVYINDSCFYAHTHCYTQTVIENDIRIEDNTKNKSYLFGFLGSIIGSLIGCLPWIILQLFFHSFASFLSCIIGMGAYKAYRYFNGRLGAFTKWIILCSTIIGVSVSMLEITIQYMFREGIPVSLKYINLLLQNKQIYTMFSFNLIVSLGMVVVNFFSISKDIRIAIAEAMPKLGKSV